MTKRTVEEHAMTAANVATYGGAGGAVAIWGLSLSEWAAIVSMTVALLGFGLQLYLALRVIRREERDKLAQS